MMNREAVVRVAAGALDEVALGGCPSPWRYAEAIVSALEEAMARAIDHGVTAEVGADLVVVLARHHARWHGRDEEDEDLDTLFAVAALEELFEALRRRLAQRDERVEALRRRLAQGGER